MGTGPGHETDCSRCRVGAHNACEGVAFDADADQVVECECRAGGHA